MEDRFSGSGRVNGDWTWWLCSNKRKKEADTRDMMLTSCTWEPLVTMMKVRISWSSSVARSPRAEHMDRARVRVSLVFETETVTGCVRVLCPTFLSDDAAERRKRGNIPSCHAARPAGQMDGWIATAVCCSPYTLSPPSQQLALSQFLKMYRIRMNQRPNFRSRT